MEGSGVHAVAWLHYSAHGPLESISNKCLSKPKPNTATLNTVTIILLAIYITPKLLLKFRHVLKVQFIFLPGQGGKLLHHLLRLAALS